ncbi:MAG: hypothetical protein KAT15_22925, partial [Bacteroidales bacterium]|nr:hypothetical protein [Bacteroidales bacterium]
MTRHLLRTTYSERIKQFQAAIRQRTRTINYISLFRLISGVALIYFLVLGIRQKEILFYALSLLMVVLFLILVSLHNRHKEVRNLLRQLKALNETELSGLDHQFHDLPDGEAYADTSHPWSHDLDLFGKGSLFQYLNRTSILMGGERLSKLLTTEPEGIESIRLRQGIIGDLKDRIDFRQNFTARGRLIREKDDDLRNISHWISTGAYITKYRWLFYMALGISAVATAIIAAGIIDPSNFRFLLPLLLLNLTLLSPFFQRTNLYQASISRKHELLEGYAELLK